MPAAQPVYPGQTTLSAAPEPRGYGSILPPHLHCPPPLGLCPRCAPGLPGPIPAFSLQRGPHFLLRGASCDPRLRVRALLHSPSALHACQVAQLCPTLRPYGPQPSGSSVHGILQARILEWVAISSSRGSFQPRDRTRLSYVSRTGGQVLYHLHHLGSSQAHPSENAQPWARPAVCGAPVGERLLFTAMPHRRCLITPC